METISTLAGLFLFAVLIAMIIGLINPRWISLNKNKVYSRKQISIYGFIALIVLTAIGVSTAPTPIEKTEATNKSNTEEKAKPVKEEIEPVVTAEVTPDLKVTPEELRNKFNEKLKSIDIPNLRPLAEFSIKEGSVKNTFTENITSGVSMVGTVNKNGKIDSLTVIYDNSEPEKEGVYFLIISGSLIQIISNDKDAPKQVVDVINKAIENYDSNDSNNYKVINDIKYSAISNRATGTWFSIEPK
jgi:hypothetical protein